MKCLSRSRSGFPIHALFSLAVASFRGWREALVTNGIASWTLKKMWQQLSICLRNGEKTKQRKRKEWLVYTACRLNFLFRKKYAYSRGRQYKTWTPDDISEVLQSTNCRLPTRSGILINPRFPVWIARF